MSADKKVPRPSGIAVSQNGNVYVTDMTTDKVYVFSYQGEYIRAWGGEGSDIGKFKDPYGIATSPQLMTIPNIKTVEYVFVADMGNCRVQKFTPDGKFVKAWGSYGKEIGQFMSPYDIVEVPGLTRLICVADGNNPRLQLFTKEGQFVRSIDTSSFFPRKVYRNMQGIGFCYFPREVTVNGKKKKAGYRSLVITDSRYILQIINEGDNFENISHRIWDVFGSDRDQIGTAYGIDSRPLESTIEEYVYVADAQKNKLFYYTTNGKLKGSWGEYGTEKAKFSGLRDVAIAPNGTVFTIEIGNGRIQHFTKEGDLLNSWFLPTNQPKGDY